MLQLFDHLLFRAIDLWIIARYPKLPRVHRAHRGRTGRPGPIRIALPTCASEKFVWRKLFDRDPRFSILNDKLACKAWVREQGIDAPMPRTLWVGTDASDIPAELFEKPIVIKANFGSGLNLFHNGGPAERTATIAAANAMFANADPSPGLWDYFRIDPKLFVEDWLLAGKNPCDLLVMACGDAAVQIKTAYGFKPDRTIAFWFLDTQGNFVRSDTADQGEAGIDQRPLPKTTDRAIDIARRIGRDFDHIRVDFLCGDETLFLGELTFNSSNSLIMRGFDPDTTFNRTWDLRKSRFMSSPQRGWREVYRRSLWRELDRAARG